MCLVKENECRKEVLVVENDFVEYMCESCIEKTLYPIKENYGTIGVLMVGNASTEGRVYQCGRDSPLKESILEIQVLVKSHIG